MVLWVWYYVTRSPAPGEAEMQSDEIVMWYQLCGVISVACIRAWYTVRQWKKTTVGVIGEYRGTKAKFNQCILYCYSFLVTLPFRQHRSSNKQPVRLLWAGSFPLVSFLRLHLTGGTDAACHRVAARCSQSSWPKLELSHALQRSQSPRRFWHRSPEMIGFLFIIDYFCYPSWWPVNRVDRNSNLTYLYKDILKNIGGPYAPD